MTKINSNSEKSFCVIYTKLTIFGALLQHKLTCDTFIIFDIIDKSGVLELKKFNFAFKDLVKKHYWLKI
jgi:hypothetical protein